jgi:hypothetical protein
LGDFAMMTYLDGWRLYFEGALNRMAMDDGIQGWEDARDYYVTFNWVWSPAYIRRREAGRPIPD